jgi:hypothetical protein
VAAYRVEDASATGLLVQSQVGSKAPVAVQRRVTGEGGDPALVGGSLLSRSRWLVLPPLSPKGGQSTLVVQNPGQSSARLEMRLFGAEGAIASGIFGRLTVAPGRSLAVDLSRVAGDRPVTALLTTIEGTIVVGGASYALNEAGYASTLGLSARLGR